MAVVSWKLYFSFLETHFFVVVFTCIVKVCFVYACVRAHVCVCVCVKKLAGVVRVFFLVLTVW